MGARTLLRPISLRLPAIGTGNKTGRVQGKSYGELKGVGFDVVFPETYRSGQVRGNFGLLGFGQQAIRHCLESRAATVINRDCQLIPFDQSDLWGEPAGSPE